MGRRVLLDREALLDALSQDTEALTALGNRQKDLFLQCIRPHVKLQPDGDPTDHQIFRAALSCIQQPGGQLSENVAQAITAYNAGKKSERISKRHFIYEAGLNTLPDIRDSLLESLPTISVKPLSTPYPPFKSIISESQAITEKWYSHFAYGKQPDSRLPRLSIHQLDASSLVADIGPNDSAILKNASGKLVGLVLRNFCESEAGVVWASAAAAAQLPDRRNIRMEDTGKLVQLGWSAGQRSKHSFHWVQNITTRALSADEVDKLNKDAGCLFAFSWQLMSKKLPPEVVSDFNLFVSGESLPRMNVDFEAASQAPLQPSSSGDFATGDYTVDVEGHAFEFHNVELAPPSGVVGENYSRATHRETQPHSFAASWTILRTPDAEGCHFYFARYGVRAQQASNTLIVWRPMDAHGTSLPDVKPGEVNPAFRQRGLAFVTSNRLASAWRKFQSKQITRAEALQMAEASEGGEHEELFE